MDGEIYGLQPALTWRRGRGRSHPQRQPNTDNIHIESILIRFIWVFVESCDSLRGWSWCALLSQSEDNSVVTSIFTTQYQSPPNSFHWSLIPEWRSWCWWYRLPTSSLSFTKWGTAQQQEFCSYQLIHEIIPPTLSRWSTSHSKSIRNSILTLTYRRPTYN